MGLFTGVFYLGDGVAALDIGLAYFIENLTWFVPAISGAAILTLLYEDLFTDATSSEVVQHKEMLRSA
ncbi:hypothetical protein [Roseinatronobacter alkalisoli]|uniref:Uncharacterized protein n=1 Tax=Roseinatronobacter alkalisoli TaxID=3028235 RepID=A0ABT5THY5_9RHOB|nr:hypothetical protein [Roseinatronobacter sp. HJB301]MDD7973817.1 hypothetical protein [Roseinatronobacter sp. HJB301]